MDWKRVEQATRPPKKRPADSFTAAEYAERFGMTVITARRRLLELSRKGRLAVEDYVENGKAVRGYRLKEEPNGR